MSQPKIAKKFTKAPYFGGSKSFKVIDVDIYKKLRPTAYYDRLATIFTLDDSISVK